jgi:phenylacetate-coenzyme A ligase PaaK-like adenylate-forming protein
MLNVLADFDPTHICGGARYLIRGGRSLAGRLNPNVRRVCFVAGEPLNEISRDKCAKIWNASVVNVYGMAEFDMIGAELPLRPGLSLVRDFRYGLITEPNTKPASLAPGAVGELAISLETSDTWHFTGDIVKVRAGSEAEGWTIDFVERARLTAMFADGAMIVQDHISEVLQKFPELQFIQACVTHRYDGDRLELLCVATAAEAEEIPQRALELLLETNVDLNDAYKHGVVTEISARWASEDELRKTERGKCPPLIEIENG